jgi:uncharacterized protein YijF (DUF1287 family)
MARSVRSDEGAGCWGRSALVVATLFVTSVVPACRSAKATPPAVAASASSAVATPPRGPDSIRTSSTDAQEGAASRVLRSAGAKVVDRARQEVTRAVRYDPGYRVLTFKAEIDTHKAVYPAGDVDPAIGVCTDLVVRALRAASLDLQRSVHDDVLAHPEAYPSIAARPDANIDHRRVTPVLLWMQRHARSLPRGTVTASDRATWLAGDVVVWAFHPCPQCTPDHVGIVSDRARGDGLPKVLHNLGPTPTEDDALDEWTVLGHFRPVE